MLVLAFSPPAGEGQTATPTAGPGTLTIDHQAPGCVLAGKYALLAACFTPEATLSRARVYFRAGGAKDWFYVEMSGKPPCLEGVLPRPKKDLTRIEYYMAATDRSFAESRTPERALEVSANDGRCSTGPLAPVSSAAGVVIGSVSGAVPAGFATGGGLSPLLIAGGVAVVGGGAAAIAVGGGGSSSSAASSGSSCAGPTCTAYRKLRLWGTPFLSRSSLTFFLSR